MKKLNISLIITIIMTLVLGGTGIIFHNSTLEGDSPADNHTLQFEEVDENYLEDYVKNYLIAHYSPIYTASVSLNKESFETDGNSYNLVVLVNLNLKLKIKNSSLHPVILAIENFKKNNQLLPVEESFINNYEANYRSAIERYIKDGLEAYIRIKVEYKDGKIEMLAETPRGGMYETIESALKLPSDAEIKSEMNNALSSLMLTIAKTGLSGINYSGEKASEYAKTYTSNTNKICCEGDPTNQDTAFYNQEYEFAVGYDCANYASQSLHAGGVPYSSTWNPSAVAWNYVDFTDGEEGGIDLFSFVTTYYASVSEARVVSIPGTIALIDWNSNDSPDHAIVIVENDGYTTLYCAHTSDRKSVILPNDLKDVYYLIMR
ncbi:MAG: amidase domain-containing protein [Caldisericaceae bacterium]